MKIGQFHEYRGYIGSIEYDAIEKLHFGYLINTDDSVNYHAKTFEDLYLVYQQAIDRYIRQKEEIMEKKTDTQKCIDALEHPSEHIHVEKDGTFSYSSDMVKAFEIAIKLLRDYDANPSKEGLSLGEDNIYIFNTQDGFCGGLILAASLEEAKEKLSKHRGIPVGKDTGFACLTREMFDSFGVGDLW